MTGLPDWFWAGDDGNPLVPPPEVPPSFHKTWGLTNAGAPSQYIHINRGDQLRVSWVLGKDNRPVMVKTSTGRKGISNTHALVVGWPEQDINHRLVRWLPLSGIVLEMVQAAYEEPGMDPRKNDLTLKKDGQGRWGYESCGQCILTNLKEQSPGEFRDLWQLVLLTLDRWPGQPTAGRWLGQS